MFPLVTNTSAVSLVKIIITEKKTQNPWHFKGHLIPLSTRTQHMVLAVSVPPVPSTSLLQELTKVVISKQESLNHSFPALLLLPELLTTSVSVTSFKTINLPPV